MRHHRHVFVCVQHRDGGGKPACGDRGGCELLAAVEAMLVRVPSARIGATGTACLGPCFDGPNALVYPEGTWYAGLVTADARAIVDGDAAALAAKLHPWTGDDES
jgi:(2Fe-2S) ferredoxin